MSLRSFAGVVAVAALALAPAALAAEGPNGFDLSNARVPVGEIVEGGPPRDAIGAVSDPAFVSPDEALWVEAPNPVLGVVVGESAHCYPEHLMDRHQIVDDELDDRPVVVTWDPLAGSPRAYDRQVDGRTLTFGVSGLVYNHNFLLFDRETDSLWVQFTGEAISGPLAGKRLAPLAIRREPYAVWRERYPQTQVLARPDPKRLDYRHNPYLRYITDDQAIFPVKAEDFRFHQKEIVLGIRAGGVTRAYLGSLMTAAGGKAVDEVGGAKVRITYDPGEGVFGYDVPPGVEADEAYWLAWKAFYPDTEIWHEPEAGSD